MTITNTAQSLAHDAANAASDLASTLAPRAAELGNKAAEIGSEAASSVAAAATNLAHVIGKKVPAVQKKRRSSPWRMIVLLGVAAAGAFAFMKSRRSSTVTASSSEFVPKATAPTSSASTSTAPTSTAPTSTASTATGTPGSNGKKADSTADETAKH